MKVLVYNDWEGEYVYISTFSLNAVRNMVQRAYPFLENLKDAKSYFADDEVSEWYHLVDPVVKVDELAQYFYDQLCLGETIWFEVDGSDENIDNPHLHVIELTDKPYDVR